jgi:hypothetical protein
MRAAAPPFASPLVFCFAKLEDADAFAERFGGERLPGTWR